MNSSGHNPHAHLKAWPIGVPLTLEVPDESLWMGLAARAKHTPQGVGLHFLGLSYTWQQIHQQALQLAAALQHRGLSKGDRVILFMQNCPHYIVALYAVLYTGAVVVPINPMSKADELEHYLRDTGAVVAIASSDIAHEIAQAHRVVPPGQSRMAHLVVFDLADGLPDAASPSVQQWPHLWQTWLLARHTFPKLNGVEVVPWQELLSEGHQATPVHVSGDDLALLPYTSGTTGAPKGCMHTHATLLHNVLAAKFWIDLREGDVQLVAVPMFHITGLVMGLLATVCHGCSMVLLPRWDRTQAAQAIACYRVTHWPNIPTMVIDLLASPDLEHVDLSSLRYIGGGGAPMPEAVALQLRERFGLEYLEGYGLTETAAPTHTNPRGASRRACLGIPYISTEARVIDPETFTILAHDEVGEIVVSGPQVFKGYWQQEAASQAAFVQLEGKTYFRTGDLGFVDSEGYYTIADRLKRMINASGFKVWPAEVEGLLHRHPAVQEACVIAMRDAYRGESVKAVVVVKAPYQGTLQAADLMAWAREHMAVYKAPREIEFVTALPHSASGKLMWRVVQAEHDKRQTPTASPL